MAGLTVGASKQLMLQYINEYSVNGELTSEQENQDYLNRHNGFAQSVQLSLAPLFPLNRVFPICQRSLARLILAGGFGFWDVLPGEEKVIEGQGPGAYYCEIGGPGQGTVEAFSGGAWQVLATLQPQSDDFTAFKANLPAEARPYPVRLRFKGEYPFFVKNAALYRYPFGEGQIPVCRPWLRYEMPDDFLRLDQVVREEGRQYATEAGFFWENERTLVLPHDLDAQLSVFYWAYPPSLDPEGGDGQLLGLPLPVAQLIPLKVAALVIPEEKWELSHRLLQLYEQELLRLQTEQRSQSRALSRVYAM